jgi:hypothetical protein
VEYVTIAKAEIEHGPVMIADWSVPKWVSWVSLIVLAASLFSGLGSQQMMNTETGKLR